ncbi:MAG: NADH:flavin oxidoreductase/NADH oxidase family protein [Paracoccaceae bacterium]|jgi:2,4-dienoyl-CoA reductase-like NADH-dependent reductase (Old Yellow Enzyme family)|nr:NADH:flavin oxidoreductase/NADH oxidase family protein [Paracoccaceae bacterium]MDG1371099.1 NADH:flavin oxidoreductase/NADH oxidase family protein [Paracoccaceae bacterium]
MLDQPLELPCGAILSNRLAKAALTERIAVGRMEANEAHENLYRRWSHSGAGLIITGNVIPDRIHPEAAGNVALDAEADLEALRRYAAAGTEAGNHIWMQISHAGRQTPGAVNSAPHAPSAVPMVLKHGDHGDPVAMTENQIRAAIDSFAWAAGKAKEVGFTGVQIHGAHGYLISQFLNPRVNKRDDQWGGPLENRARLALEIVREVRAAVGHDFPVSIKLNSTDFQSDGFTLDDCVAVVQWLENNGVDLLEVSGGNYEIPAMVMGKRGEAPVVKESTQIREAFFIDYAAELREHSDIPMMVTGGFRTHAAMAEALEVDAADVIGLGRTLISEPDLPARILSNQANALDVEAGITPPYARMPWYYAQLQRMGRGEAPDLSLTGEEAMAEFKHQEAATLAALKG